MESFINSSSHTLLITGSFVALYAMYHILNLVYTVFFHPLSHVPGPWYAAATRIPYMRHSLNGSLLPWMQKLHARYGEIVRYSPNEVSVISGKDNPWQDIYGFRTGKQKHTDTFEKDRAWYPVPLNGYPSVLGTTAADHGRQRRILSHAFSDKALREQEGVLQSYVDLLISRLRDISAKTPEYSNGGDGWDSTGRVELCKWYNGFTFDVISDLCFGEPFGSLRDMKQHSWVGSILEGLKAVKFSYVLHYFPIVKRMGSLIVNPAQIRQRAQLYEWIKEKTETRVATETQRADFITAIMQHQNSRFEGDNSKEADAMRIGELVSNVGLFLVAGTETTATTLSIGSFLLLANPDVLHRLSTETRSRYQTEADITVDSVAHFDYLNAFIHEIMRCYPPVPAGFLRKVPETGAQVAGYNLPGNGNISISVNQYIANRSSLNFVDPEQFVPERWLTNPPSKYTNDNLSIVQPFSFGPRNCLGKNLAYAELRLVFAKMLYNFDLELDVSRSASWNERLQHHTLFYRPDLWVKLTCIRD